MSDKFNLALSLAELSPSLFQRIPESELSYGNFCAYQLSKFCYHAIKINKIHQIWLLAHTNSQYQKSMKMILVSPMARLNLQVCNFCTFNSLTLLYPFLFVSPNLSLFFWPFVQNSSILHLLTPFSVFAFSFGPSGMFVTRLFFIKSFSTI